MPGHAVVVDNLYKTYRIRVRGFLRARYKTVEALRGVSFSVRHGMVYGLLGPNGAGKTTTVKIISTLLEPDSGDAYVLGYSSVREAPMVRRHIGVMLSVERGFFWKLTARENLRYFGMIYGLRGRTLEERIREVLEVTGLTSLGAADRKFEDMSLGMRARLGLARAMLKDPEVLILDEPTLGLDPPSARHIRELLRSMAREGKTIILTTHNMFEAEMVCDRIGIIDKGRLAAEGSPRDLKEMVSGHVSVSFTISALDPWSIERRLRDAGLSFLYSVDGSTVRLRVKARRGEEADVIEHLARVAREHGALVKEVRIEEPTLEDVFIEVTGGGRWG